MKSITVGNTMKIYKRCRNDFQLNIDQIVARLSTLRRLNAIMFYVHFLEKMSIIYHWN